MFRIANQQVYPAIFADEVPACHWVLPVLQSSFQVGDTPNAHTNLEITLQGRPGCGYRHVCSNCNRRKRCITYSER